MKKYSFINRIIYIINPKKSLTDFLDEAENIVINYEKAPLESFFINGGINVCSKSYSKVKRKKPDKVLYMVAFSLIFAGVYMIFKFI